MAPTLASTSSGPREKARVLLLYSSIKGPVSSKPSLAAARPLMTKLVDYDAEVTGDTTGMLPFTNSKLKDLRTYYTLKHPWSLLILLARITC